MRLDKKIRLGLIFGGRSGEHEVSLMSARSISMALDTDKYEVIQIGITHEGDWLVGEDVLGIMTNNQTKKLISATMLPDPTRRGIYTIRQDQSVGLLEHLADLDVVFPVLHGTFGEDGTIQGLFEIAGIAYVGAGVLGSSLAMDKGVFRKVMKTHALPVVETLAVLKKDIESRLEEVIGHAEELAPYPLFVKPANLGSSVGVSKCQNKSDLLEGLMEAARYDRRVLVERGVNAREIEISVLGNDDPVASLPGEVIPGAEFYSYDAKYHDNRSELLIPAPLSGEITEQVREYAIEAYRAIDCAGMARVDFFLDRDSGELILNELNTIPGFTKISMYPKLWEASGLPYPALVDRLIELALERKKERDRIETRYYRQ
jgi:D-alanine-D-alanine ligase